MYMVFKIISYTYVFIWMCGIVIQNIEIITLLRDIRNKLPGNKDL